MRGAGQGRTTQSGQSDRPERPAGSGVPTPPADSPLSPVLERALALEPLLRTAAGLTIAAVLVCALYFGREVLVPIALAGFLGFLLDPLVTRLKRWGVPRALAAVLVTFAALFAIIAIGTYMVSQLRGLSADLPTYQDTITSKLSDLRQRLNAPSDWDGALSTLRVVSEEFDEATGGDDSAPARPPQTVVVADAESGPVRTALSWMARIGGPAVTAGIVMLFVVLILIDRDGLRDRVLRVMGGGNLHLATDALREAGTRIGRYLRMQLVVNASYGVPLAAGLYFIGVPGAALWGVLAIVLRFVPYLGPLLCALFPLVLAFAVDPGWSMVLWTVALILTLELVSNNAIEPWLYGASTGLSPLSVIVAAMFWTTLWGPVGLVLSTPLTVCLLVLGRHMPGLSFFETLLGSAPVLDAPNRLYQRLLAGNVVDATDLASEAIDARIHQRDEPLPMADALVEFYDTVAIPALRLASAHHTGAATARHRLHLTTGMSELLQELQDDYPATTAETVGPRVHCIGARWEIDALAAQMLAHALNLFGLKARSTALTGGRVATADLHPALQPGDIVCVSVFHPDPKPVLRLITRRLRRLQRDVSVIAVPWTLAGNGADIGELDLADGWAGSIRELVRRLRIECGPASDGDAPASTADSVRSALPTATAAAAAAPALDARVRERHRELVRQVADAFDVAHAQVGWSQRPDLLLSGSTLLAGQEGAPVRLPESDVACRLVIESGQPVVIEDVQRDPRVAQLPALLRERIRFYAGVPLRDPELGVVGSLCIMDTRPGTLDDSELALLKSMADKVLSDLKP